MPSTLRGPASIQPQQTVITSRLAIVLSSQQYAAAKENSDALRHLSITADACNCLSRTHLEMNLASMEPYTHQLTRRLLDCDSYMPATNDPYELESQLRYWKVSNNGTKKLFSEWIEYFLDRAEDLTLAPYDVQEMMENLQEADVNIQQRALEASCTELVPHTPTTHKRSFDDYSQDSVVERSPTESSEISARKKARFHKTVVEPTSSVPARNTRKTRQKPLNTSKMTDEVRGRKASLWSRSRTNAWVHVLGVPLTDLPSASSEGNEHELESHCTPASADLRLCGFPVSIEEILTVR